MTKMNAQIIYATGANAVAVRRFVYLTPWS